MKAISLFLLVLGTLGLATQAQEGDLTKHVISVDGGDRVYFDYVSTKANSFNGQWVVFALHDNGQSASQFATQSGWVKIAEENGFAVVFPQAVNNRWPPVTGADDAYLKAVFDHARTHLISRYPGDNQPTGPGDVMKETNNPIWAWEPLRDLTGDGAGATVAQEFAMNYPGLFAAVATLNGVAFEAAYDKGEEPAQAYFQAMRGKQNPPVWKQLKKEVPETVWMFNKGPATPEQARQANYWRASLGVAATTVDKTIGGFQTTIYQNPQNAAEQFRSTQLAAEAHYDEALASAIWRDMFAHVARWTSSPNGDLVKVLTEAEVNRQFEVRSIDVGDGKPYQYLLKMPSSYKAGQRLPLVVSLHGGNEQPWLFLSKIKMHEVGEREGFITVYPMGHRNHWESDAPDGPDAKFLEMLIKEVVNTHGADPTRVYLQGFSNGSGMAHMMGLTHPQLFAATSPTNGPGPLPKSVQKVVDDIKTRRDVRLPVMAVYGSVDSSATVDGKFQSGSAVNLGIDTIKRYDNIVTADASETFNSKRTKPYKALTLKGAFEAEGIDKRYPAGRFQVYSYMSDDPVPLNLLRVVWVVDLPHAYDLREAKLQWDYFKHWSRNADGSLNYAKR